MCVYVCRWVCGCVMMWISSSSKGPEPETIQFFWTVTGPSTTVTVWTNFYSLGLSCPCPVAGCVWEGATECVDVCGGSLRHFARLMC